MPLATGQTLSFYEILGSLGAGTMGEVYRAMDTRLGREVAIKVLPEHFAEDDERLRRFEREAKSLASLNHSNVAQIFGVDQVGDTCFLVLELVPGETLEDRIARGPLPPDEAVDLCRQIAEGLEVAHEAGVIHRDLKPANVRVTPDGVVKLLDFGLAKPTGPGAAGAATTDSALSTEHGRLIGTPTYMAPEQARGLPIDRRVDVWAFGCVLYECLTGRRAFEGETLSDVLAAVLEKEPDWSRLPALPPRVRELLERALAKDPRQRLRDVGEARVLLERPDARAASSEVPRQWASWALPLVALVGLGLGLVAGARALAPRATEPAADLALSVHLDRDEVLSAARLPNLVIAPDGGTVVWVGGGREELHVRRLTEYGHEVLVGTEGASAPFFSPDGAWIGFVQGGVFKKVAVTGGKPVVISGLGDYGGSGQSFRGAAWCDDGWIVFSPTFAAGLHRVRAEGGTPEEFVTRDPERSVRTLRWPSAPPGADLLLYTRDDSLSQDYYDDADIVARSLSSGREVVAVQGASMARYASGTLVFARGGSLFAQAFDPATLTSSGEPALLVDGVETDGTSGAAQFAVSADGSLVYTPGGVREASLRLAWRDTTSLEWLDLPAGAYRYPRLSPDGERLAYVFAEPDASSVWIHDFARGTSTPQMRRGDAVGICWAPDGERIYFGSLQGGSDRQGLYVLDVDGGGETRLVAEVGSSFLVPLGFLPDGVRLLARSSRLSGGFQILIIDTRTGDAEVLLGSDTDERGAAVHPDGEWFAYTSNRTGNFEVYLHPVGDGPTLPPASSGGGLDPLWSRDGKTLYHVKPGRDELWAVDVTVGPEPELGVPYPVLGDFYHRGSVEYSYDQGEDGRLLTLMDTTGLELGREVRVRPGLLARGESR